MPAHTRIEVYTLGGATHCEFRRPAISVITPFYNRREWLTAYIAMLERQRLKDFEVVLVDDGSTDGLLNALADARTSFRLRCLRLIENCGAGAARNIGIDHAVGSYVALLDSDDTWHPAKLARHLALLEAAHDSDRLVGLSRHLVIGARNFVRPTRIMTRTDSVGSYLFQQGGVIQTSTMFLATDLARTARFAEGEPGHDDWTFALRLEALGARFEMIEEPLTYYRDDERADRRSPRQAHISLEWLDRYRGLLGEDAYLAGRAVFGSRLRNAPLESVRIIITAFWRGAVPAWRSAYYLGAWAFPTARTIGIFAKQAWLALRTPRCGGAALSNAADHDT